MNPLKAEKLFALMKQYGVEYFKHDDLEIKFGEPNEPTVKVSKERASKTKVAPSQAIPPVESSIPHHVNEVANLLKLDDYALVDKLFPDYSQIPKENV